MLAKRWAEVLACKHQAYAWCARCLRTYLRADLGSCFDQALHNACIGVEQVIAGHSRLSWNPCWDDDKISAFESGLEALFAIECLDLHQTAAISHIFLNKISVAFWSEAFEHQ